MLFTTIIVITLIPFFSFAQKQINPTPGQIFWLEKSGMVQLTDQPGRPLDENCKPTFEASCTGIITNLAITSTDGGKSINSNPHRGSTATVLIVSKAGLVYQLTAPIVRTPASWENMLTGGEWKKKSTQDLWNYKYTFQTADEDDGPPTCTVIRQFSEEGGEEYFINLDN